MKKQKIIRLRGKIADLGMEICGCLNGLVLVYGDIFYFQDLNKFIIILSYKFRVSLNIRRNYFSDCLGINKIFIFLLIFYSL